MEKQRLTKNDFMSLLLIGFGLTMLALGFIPALKFVGCDSLLGNQIENKTFYNAFRLLFNGSEKTTHAWLLLLSCSFVILTALTSVIFGALNFSEVIKVNAELVLFVLTLLTMAFLIVFVICFFSVVQTKPQVLLECFGLAWESQVFSDFLISTYVYFLFFVDLIVITVLFLSKDYK